MRQLAKSILFTKPNIAKLQTTELPDMTETSVLVKTAFSTVSAGTERANLIGESNISGTNLNLPITFPRQLGYSSVGIVEAIGKKVTSLNVGDKVIVYFGKHNSFNLVDESAVLKITEYHVSMEEAAMIVIIGFPALGIRRTRLEMGESTLIFGLGILGLFAVELARIAGAVPVIAADLNPDRRKLALQLGADAAFDPRSETFTDDVLAMTRGGANVVIEASGVADALIQAMHTVAAFGRISLLGCTRNPVKEVDFYHYVHAKGVAILGTNNFARPVFESQPGNWTWKDDCNAMLRLIELGRLKVTPMIGEICSPADAPLVYNKLAMRPDEFPIGMLFDWSRL